LGPDPFRFREANIVLCVTTQPNIRYRVTTLSQRLSNVLEEKNLMSHTTLLTIVTLQAVTCCNFYQVAAIFLPGFYIYTAVGRPEQSDILAVINFLWRIPPVSVDSNLNSEMVQKEMQLASVSRHYRLVSGSHLIIIFNLRFPMLDDDSQIIGYF
jgi:hypothetical protein